MLLKYMSENNIQNPFWTHFDDILLCAKNTMRLLVYVHHLDLQAFMIVVCIMNYTGLKYQG